MEHRVIPKLSVGLPVYNGERFLALAIEGFLSQTYTDFELIISDNASTDKTREICEEYAKKDQRIRYVRSETNLGAAPNHNRTFELSRGEYFKWAAHDDESDPNLLSRCMEWIERAPDSVVLVYTEAELIDSEGQTTGHYQTSVACADPRPYRRLSKVMKRIGLGTPMYGIARTEALRKTRMHGSYIGADYVFVAEVALVGEIQIIREPLLKKRIHADRYMGAARTKSERLRWFNMREKKAVDFLHRTYRLMWECFLGVRRQRLGFIETTLCGFAILGYWVRLQRVKLGRWKQNALRFLRIRDRQSKTENV